MPEVKISIGGRDYDVACQEGEEHFLRAAAEMLNTEAMHLVNQIGRMPESRMLLMSGLLLADKTAGVEDKFGAMEARLATQEAELENLRAGAAAAPPGPSEEEIAALRALADRAEALAGEVEERAGS
ncbi:MAG: cell division protein ZapA [Pseudomonadota bacterium]